MADPTVTSHQDHRILRSKQASQLQLNVFLVDYKCYPFAIWLIDSCTTSFHVIPRLAFLSAVVNKELRHVIARPPPSLLLIRSF